MIGSLMYYALYPLTRFINSISESEEGSSSEMVNGGEVWEGGSDHSRRLNKQQSALLDQWQSKDYCYPKTGELAEEDGSTGGFIRGEPLLRRGEEDQGLDEALRTEAIQEEVWNARHSMKMTESTPDLVEGTITTSGVRDPREPAMVGEWTFRGCSSEQENEGMSLRPREDTTVRAREGEGEKIVKAVDEEGVSAKAEDGMCTSAAPDSCSKEGSQGERRITQPPEFKKTQMDGEMVSMTSITLLDESSAAETHTHVSGGEETAIAFHPCPHVSLVGNDLDMGGGESQANVASDKMSPKIAAVSATNSSTVAQQDTRAGANISKVSSAPMDEIWETEQVTHTVGVAGAEALEWMGCPAFDLGTLLAEAEAFGTPHQSQHVPIGWHFAVGPGLAEIAHCPAWQSPVMSYYPALQVEKEPFEVMWRVWEDLSEAGTDATPPQPSPGSPRSQFQFSVMSYNILAQDLLEANPQLYAHRPEEALCWDKRLKKILLELQTWSPDVLCLQEVQEDHFIEQLHPALTAMGYTTVYKCRTGTKTDGCAVCYRGNRFSQASLSVLEFRRQNCELMDRDNVGIVILLQPIGREGEGSGFGPVCVANTHLLFNPRRGDVKLAQLAIMLAEIDSVARQCKLKGSRCSVILCGDFNSLPHVPLYQFITTGQLYYQGMPAWMVSGQEDLSYKIHHRRLFVPLWPSSLGISDRCQYLSDHGQETKQLGKLRYSHDFLLRLRYCQAACARPHDLKLIPGVTDNAPNPEENLHSAPRFRNTICHGLDLQSVYSHTIPGTNQPEVTTLHSEYGATVDYIFYSAGSDGNQKGKAAGLRLLGRLGLLSEADLWSMTGLPNEAFPSDHLSLLAKFQLDSDL